MNNRMYANTIARPNTEVMNRVLRNTYALLSMLFVFGAGTAWLAQTMHWRIGFWPFLIGIFAFSWAIGAARNSAWGIVIGFAFSGFLGVMTGANVDQALYRYANGGELVVASFGLTAFVFFALSAYAMNTRRDFSNTIAFLSVGTIVLIGAIVLNYFLQLPALWLAMSAMAVLLASGWIIWQTQRIVRGGETNYIIAATTLLADIFVLFNNLLHLLGFGFGDD